jgi:hypothetical protein
MSLNGVTNTVFPNTLNGLDSLNVTNITIDGQTLASLFVPYTGALSNVDLNNKSLTGINGLTAGAVTSSGLIQGGNLTATSLTTTNTLKINSVPSGTQVTLLAYDASGNVIQGTVPLQSLFDITATSASVNLFPAWLSSTSGGSQPIYADSSSDAILYNSGTKILTIRNLKLSSVPAGTQTKLLAVDAAGNVIEGTVTIPPPTQLLTTATSSGATIYYPTFVTSQTTGDKSYFVERAVGYSSYFQETSTPGASGTWYLTNVRTVSLTITGDGLTYDPLPPTVAFSGIAWALGLNSAGQTIKYTPGSATAVTTTNVNFDLNMLFTNAFADNSNASIFIDSGLNIKYNPSTDTFTVPNLTVGSSATIPGYALLASPALTGTPTAPTAAPGTNTTQIATTAFVLANVPTGSFLPLAGGTLTGSITFATTNTLPITLTSATGTAYTYSIRDTQWAHTFLQYITATTGTFPQLRTDVPIGVGSSYTALMSLPYNAGISYTKTIQNTGGDTFMTFASSAPSLSLSAFTSFNVAAIANRTVGLFGVNGTSNDGVAMWLTSGGTQSGSLVLSDTYGTTIATATPTTSWGRYFAVGGQVFQDFYGAFEWRGTNTLGATTWSTVASVAKMSTAQMGFRMGSMFDFSSAGTWDNNNSLFVTTGGLGGTNNGVGIGYNTTIGTGLLVSIAPNVAWRPMRYKAEQHQFFVGNVSQAGVNQYGLYAENAGYFTNFTGAINAGLGGVGSGDLVFYANSSGVHRFFSGGTQALVIAPAGGTGLAFGTSGIGLTTVAGATYGNVSTYGAGLNGWSGYDLRKRWTLMSNDAGANQSGYHDNQNSWVWTAEGNAFWLRQPNNYFSQLPQQSYVSNQVLIGVNNNRIEWGTLYSTFYYAQTINWRGGVLVASFFKASATSLLRFSGAASYFVPSGGMYTTQILIYNLSTGTITNIYLNQFTNNASNHVSYPIMAQTGSGLAVGSYDVYMYTSGLTDVNDHLYILSEILPS